MTAREVLPGVHRLWFPAIDNNAYLVATDELVMIDSGPPKKAEQVLEAIRRLGRRPEDLAAILVTHHHTDHTGNLADLVGRTGAEVHVHPADSAVVREGGPRPRAQPHGFVGKAMAAMARGPSVAPAAPVARELADGQTLDRLGGIRVLHTPGHTGGHTAFLWVDRGVLFAGDAAANMLGFLGIAHLNEDTDAARSSFDRLAGMDFAAACFGHGRVIRQGAADRFRRRIRRG